jgi:hypothetical protein
MISTSKIKVLLAVVIGSIMIASPTSMIAFWVIMGGLNGIFSEFNFPIIAIYILIIAVGIYIIWRGIARIR